MSQKLLFTPIKIGSMQLKNRIVMSPMATNFGTETGDITDQQIAYYVARARGGVGMIIAESNYVSVEGRAARNRAGMCSDDVIPQHRKLTAAVHEYGAKICAQLHHSGAVSAVGAIDGLPVAPSAVNYFSLGEKYVGLIPHELSVDEIHTLIRLYAEAARRVVKSGYDALLIHSAHGYLVNQFLSPHNNHRTDEYGGSEENRMRFLLETVAAVREAVGPDFPILIRLSSEEKAGDGYKFDFIKRLAVRLEAAGVNEINFSCGNYEEIEKIMPMPHAPDCCYLPYAAEIKREGLLHIPVSTVGRITTPEMAERILQNGQADMVYVGRAMVAEPDWANKAASGERVRPCIGCNMGCQENLVKGTPIRCTVNPEVGFDNAPEAVPASKKTVLVAGGGAAGLQFALEASRLGHRVVLAEKASSLGGQLRYACVPPHKEKIAALMEYLANAVLNSPVEVRLNTPYSPALLEEVAPDCVVFATGASEIRLPLPGVDNANVYSAAQILGGTLPEGKRGVIVGGGQVGVEVAEHLLEKGKEVTVIEMTGDLLTKMGAVGKKMLLESVMKKGMQFCLNTTLKELREECAVVARLGRTVEIPMDFAVIAAGYRPIPAELPERVPAYVIGDGLRVANILEATAQAWELARKL